MPAPALPQKRPDSLPAASRVPSEHVGRARLLRDRTAAAHTKWADAAERLTAPLRPRGDFSPTFTKQSLSVMAARWKSLPEFGRLRCVARNDGARLQILETRIVPFRVVMADWAKEELSIAVTLQVVEMRIPAAFAATTKLIAVIGLHALARRYERGEDRRDVAVLRDLSVFGRAWPAAVRTGGDFDIPAARGRQVARRRHGRRGAADARRSHVRGVNAFAALRHLPARG